MKLRLKIKGITKQIAGLFLALLVVFSGVFTIFAEKTAPVEAYAANNDVREYDQTDVNDDLGTTIDLSKYPAVPGEEPQLYSFMEYCYSEDAFKRGENYALYIYVYNPSKTNYNNSLSKALIATSYEKGEDGSFKLSYDKVSEKDELKPTNYEYFYLKYCGATTGSYENLFIKFRVLNVDVLMQNAVEMESQGYERRYDLSGLQLHKTGETLADEYHVGQEIFCSGYAQGYGKGAELASTLFVRKEKGEYVELDVEHTFYRTETSSRGEGHQNQLNTVYFSVPERFFEDYGRLQRIKAEWYEYKTKMLAVTSHAEFYNELLQHIGEVHDDQGEAKKIETLNGGVYGLANYQGVGNAFIPQDVDWVYNLNYPTPTGDGLIPALYGAFLTSDISKYDPYTALAQQGSVAGNELYDWILNYKERYAKTDEVLPIKDGIISAEMFESDIDESRKVKNERGEVKQGYSYYDFDAGLDLQKMESWTGSNPAFTNKVEEFGFLAAIFGKFTEEENIELSPIEVIHWENEDKIFGNKETVDLTDADKQAIVDSLYVNYDDVDNLHAAYKEAAANNERLVLFRFSTTDYYSEIADLIIPEPLELSPFTHTITLNQAYIAQQSVFLDFDIIQLTFNDKGTYTVIPVVSNPIDIVDPITPPSEQVKLPEFKLPGETDYSWILRAVVIVAVVIFVIWIISKISSAHKQNEIYRAAKRQNRESKRKNK